MGLFSAFQGYISPSYPVTLIDPNTKSAVNLTSATNLTLYLQNKATLSVVKGSGTWTITNGASGKATYQWSAADLSVSGRFDAFVTVQLAGESNPRAFQPDEVLILAFPGVAIVAEQDVNLNQVNGTALSNANPVPTSQADGASVTIGITTDTAYSGSGAGSLVSLLKGAYNVLASMLAKLSIMISTPGYVAAYSANGATALASTEYLFKWGASGTTPINRWLVQNNSAADINVEFDATVSAGSIVIPSKQTYTDFQLPITAIHVLASADTPVNGTAANNIVIRGWT